MQMADEIVRKLKVQEAKVDKRKVTVVGAGNVGATTAQRIVEKDIADVILVDVADGIPQGKALDILQSGPILGFDTKIIRTTAYEQTAGSDIAVITAGLARKPGMSREDLLSANAKIVKGITTELVKYSPDIIIIVVTNPVDLMTYLCAEISGLSKIRSLAWLASLIPQDSGLLLQWSLIYLLIM